MHAFSSAYRDFDTKIIIAVQSGAMGQSSAGHILALKVANEGEEVLNEFERNLYSLYIKPMLDKIYIFADRDRIDRADLVI